jgi:hypothetical protein
MFYATKPLERAAARYAQTASKRWIAAGLRLNVAKRLIF